MTQRNVAAARRTGVIAGLVAAAAVAAPAAAQETWGWDDDYDAGYDAGTVSDYGYLGGAYDTDYTADDWFFDEYGYEATGYYDTYDYDYDWDADMFDWEEDGLFQ